VEVHEEVEESIDRDEGRDRHTTVSNAHLVIHPQEFARAMRPTRSAEVRRIDR